MMLNMYLALKTATEFYHRGDCARALGLSKMMQPSVRAWQAEFTELDIAADGQLLLELDRNLKRACAPSTLPRQPGFAGSCVPI